MAVRNYSSVAPETTLQSGINNVSTVILVASTTGFPAAPFTLALDYGAPIEELVDVTAVAGLSLTVTRAVDGTSAVAHSSGAKVRHVSSARDFREANLHVNASSGVHGIAGSVVGTTDTQTITNKTYINAYTQSSSGSNVPLTVRGFPSGLQGAAMTEWRDEANALIAMVDQDGSANFENLSIDTLTTLNNVVINGTVSSTNLVDSQLLTASTGWTISALSVAVQKAGWLTLNASFTRSGANITVDAAGALSTGIIGMGTLLAGVRPKSHLALMYFHAGNSIATGTARVNSSTGVIELVRWQASQTITTGNTISMTATYPLA